MIMRWLVLVIATTQVSALAEPVVELALWRNLAGDSAKRICHGQQRAIARALAREVTTAKQEHSNRVKRAQAKGEAPPSPPGPPQLTPARLADLLAKGFLDYGPLEDPGEGERSEKNFTLVADGPAVTCTVHGAAADATVEP